MSDYRSKDLGKVKAALTLLEKECDAGRLAGTGMLKPLVETLVNLIEEIEDLKNRLPEARGF